MVKNKNRVGKRYEKSGKRNRIACVVSVVLMSGIFMLTSHNGEEIKGVDLYTDQQTQMAEQYQASNQENTEGNWNDEETVTVESDQEEDNQEQDNQEQDNQEQDNQEQDDQEQSVQEQGEQEQDNLYHSTIISLGSTLMNDFSVEDSSQVLLDVEWISQYPELPTGCEITALTTVLNYYGYNVTKETMASQYLETTSYGSFYDKFVGDPFSEYGYGCYAAPIVKAANKYLKLNQKDGTAIDLSNTEFKEILGYVADGYPVIIWNTIHMAASYNTDSWEVNGKTIVWTAPEHCVVLIGYDLDQGIVYVSDPTDGIVTRDITLFEARYKEMHEQAVYITLN